MKKYILYILSCFLIIPAYSTHIAGADLTYKCLGGNDYLINFTFYRDCSGIEAPPNVVINFKSSCYTEFDITLYPSDSTGKEVTPACPGQTTYCKGGHLYGLQQFSYTGQVILPPCSDWQMSYYLCCRNYSNTVISPTASGMFIPATLNNLEAVCNSSPAFSNIPVTIICEEETFCFNHGAIDPDGDSLAYSLAAPYDKGPGSATPNLIYANGFSYDQPFPSEPPIILNPVTGDICMTPTVSIISPMAVLIEEYRKGKKIGSVLRDMQVNVIYCDNHLPKLSGMDSMTSQYDTLHNKYSDTVCIGKTIEFNLYANDPDSGNVSITWNKAIPGAEFTVTGNNTPKASAHFMWKPSDMDLRNNAYCFTATVTDEACPYVGTQTFSYCILVKGFSVSLGKDTVLCKGESYTVKAITDNNVVNFRWTLDGKALDLPTNTSKYTIETDKLSIGSHNLGIAVKDNSSTTVCPGYADLRITIVDLPKTELQEEAAICEGENLILDAGPDASRYLWNTGDTTRTIIVNSAGTYNVEADGGYGTRCLAFDTIEVSVIPMPKKVELGKDTCILSDNPNIALDAGSNAGFIYKWSTGEATQKITVTKSGEYIVTVSSAISSKCYRSDSVIINFLRQKYLGRDTCIATDNPLYKLDAGNNPNFKYLWSTGEQMQGINIRQSGKYFLTVTSASGSYCSKTDSITVNILKKNYLGTDQTLCTGTPLTLYAPEAPAGYKYKYTWKPSGDTATTLYFENKAPADIKIYLEVYGGCNDSIRIKVIACDIEIPDILIPESAENNLFRIKNIENFPDTRLTIFNRWGGKVFENAHYEEQENAWDGGDNPPGVYFYILHVSGKEYRKGTITLIR